MAAIGQTGLGTSCLHTLVNHFLVTGRGQNGVLCLATAASHTNIAIVDAVGFYPLLLGSENVITIGQGDAITSAQFFITNSAVHHSLVRTIFHTGSINFIFPHSLTMDMTGSIHRVLCHDGLAAGAAMAAGGQAGDRTGRFLGSIFHFGMAGSVQRQLLLQGHTAGFTGYTITQTGLGTGGLGAGHSHFLMHMNSRNLTGNIHYRGAHFAIGIQESTGQCQHSHADGTLVVFHHLELDSNQLACCSMYNRFCIFFHSDFFQANGNLTGSFRIHGQRFAVEYGIFRADRQHLHSFCIIGQFKLCLQNTRVLPNGDHHIKGVAGANFRNGRLQLQCQGSFCCPNCHRQAKHQHHQHRDHNLIHFFHRLSPPYGKISK